MNTQLRLKLLGYSAPVVLVAVLSTAWMLWVSMSEMSTARSFAAGVAAARSDRLDEADRDFTRVLGRTGHEDSCAARVNLELVRESRGDAAAAVFEAPVAVDHYLAAKRIVEQAPVDCFVGNTDADPERRALRADALARLDAKIAAVSAPPPPPSPPTAAPPDAPLPAGVPSVERENVLNPGQGDPLDKLQQILRDAAR